MSRREPSANQAFCTPSLSLESYTVGWICALPCELTAARAMLDHRHVRLPNQSKHDENNYTLGSIAGHNIAIACLPEYGTNKAAIAAKSMQATFPNIRFGLLVGVGGGVPGPFTDTGPANDIRLGDVVVSLPAGQGGGVIQYDLIRREVDGFRRVGVLNKPPTLLRTAVASLRAERRLGRQLTGLIEEAFVPDDESCEDQNGDDEESEADRWTYPGTERDVLFRPGYKHHGGAKDCVKCIAAKGAGDVITRRARKTTHPKVHYGNIGSGNSLIKDGFERDELGQRDNVICFEMEAAGLMDDFPCLVIRGISDYADSHKNSSWQPYAAASAAAFAKQLVRTITPQDVDRLAPIQGPLDMPARHPDRGNSGHWSILSVDLDLPFARNLRFTGRQDVLNQIQEYFSGDTTAPRTLLLYGIGGIGKTQIAAHYAHVIAKHSLAVCWADARDKHSVELGLTRVAQCVLRSLILHYGEQVAPTIFGFSDVTSLLSDDPVPPRTTQDAIRALKSWLGKKSNSGWLIVFDNYDNIEEFNIEEYFPNADHSRILITSRRPDLQRTVGKALDITGLDDNSALQLLLSGNAMYKADDTPTSPSVRAVLRKLCNLPLAIVQANAYINNRRLSMNDFLQQYEQQFNRPMGQKPRGPWNYDHVVNTTWEVSLAAIQAEDILAAETLLTCSLLGNTAILPEMMQRCIPGIRDRKYYPFVPRPRQTGVTRPQAHKVQDCFELLASYCLIYQQWNDGRFWIHPVVHKWAWTVQSCGDRSKRSVNVLRGFVNAEVPGECTIYVKDALPHIHTFVVCSLPGTETQHLDLNDARRLHSLLSVFPDEHGKAVGVICLKGLDLSRYLAIPAAILYVFCLKLSTCLSRAGCCAISRLVGLYARQLLDQSQENILQIGRLYDSAWHAFIKGRLHKAERACRKLLLALENTETTENLTGSFLMAQMLQAQIMAKHKDGSKSEYGYKLAYNLVRQIVSSKLYEKDPQSLHHVPEYGKMLLSRGDTEGARIYCSNGIQLMMDTGAPKEMILYWLDQYCDLLFLVGHCSEVKPYLRWMLDESLDTTRKCDILKKLSILLKRQNDFGELELVARQLLDLERDNISEWGDSGRIIFPTVYLCTALLETGRGTEAAMVADESLRLHQKDVGAEDPNTVFLEDFLRELRNGRLPKVSCAPKRYSSLM